MTIETGMSVTKLAQAYVSTKSTKTRKEILDYVADRVSGPHASKRKRWANFHAALVAGDAARIAFYAAEGSEAKKAAAAAIPRAAAKPKASTPAKAKPAAKPAPKADTDVQAQIDALAKSLGIDGKKMAAMVSIMSALK